ncbi:hexaprenyl pyrophosphate synthase [Sulfurisphaera tokodaii]|uniref:Hexaprenyl diphosphate synthase n=2 Tax=Sulfurisphaera tokodaii TaxID=111955 RepID=Q975C1_SULTO|nr:hexaprenyl pyrophosphate synthase [Sulfurisphaera tokodaii]BAB65480.1 hexaprenyl diphosphate synthase [Sulfurisphaera tokodaii str. 7]HII74821.1 polyprenyl synthetase family protein [Sulfurisphaera tokodaii]
MDLLSYWKKSKEIIDKLVDDYLVDIKDWQLLEVSKYILKDGKRFRGTLTFLFTEALNGDIKNAYKAALASEILHSASLALDDIVDYDIIRRGGSSAWAIYTNRKVIFITNYLIPSALNIISTYGEEALKISIQLWKDTAVGALKDIFGSPSEYLSTIELKTSSLFKLSTMLASFASHREDLVEETLDIGKYIGIAYQLVDDYIDCVKYERGELKELTGSAKQLYELKGKEYKEFVKKQYENALTNYLDIVRKLEISQDFTEAIISLPTFLTKGLLNEAGLDKL